MGSIDFTKPLSTVLSFASINLSSIKRKTLWSPENQTRAAGWEASLLPLVNGCSSAVEHTPCYREVVGSNKVFAVKEPEQWAMVPNKFRSIAYNCSWIKKNSSTFGIGTKNFRVTRTRLIFLSRQTNCFLSNHLNKSLLCLRVSEKNGLTCFFLVEVIFWLILFVERYLEQTSQVKISCLSRKQASKIDSSFTHEFWNFFSVAFLNTFVLKNLVYHYFNKCMAQWLQWLLTKKVGLGSIPAQSK